MIVHDSEYLDFSRVPESKGISKGTLVVLGIGLMVICIMGFLSVIFAGFGHIWPSEKTMRLDLGSMPTISGSPNP